MAERILVTGAGGFIGGRLTEVAHCSGMYTVRAAIRRWSSAARIARFPVEIVVADVEDARAVQSAMQGVDAVVHCATGTPDGNRTGMRNVLEAAVNARVRRVVHLSTIAVFGKQTGVLDESTPVERGATPYGDSKLDTEALCREFADRGLPIVILRPTIVYGPFGENWVVEFAQRMATGRWMLPRQDCNGTCNLLYVDDMIAAIFAALRTTTGLNQAYNINGPDPQPTWNEYFDALNAALDFPPLQPHRPMSAHAASAVMQPVRNAAKAVLARYQRPILSLYKSSALARAIMKKAESAIRQTPTVAEYDLYSRVVSFPTTMAQRGLGYVPRFSLADGVALTAGWLRHHRYVDPHRA